MKKQLLVLLCIIISSTAMDQSSNSGLFTRLLYTVSIWSNPKPLPKPVVLVHGVLSNAQAYIPTEQMIKKVHPETYVKRVEPGTSFCSLENITEQGNVIAQQINSDNNLANGFHVVAHSQGNLVFRSAYQNLKLPTVYNYISEGGPQAGVYGIPDGLRQSEWLNNVVDDEAYELLYRPWIEHHNSVAEMWKDPLHYDEYLHGNDHLLGNQFLRELNNEIDHPQAEQYKKAIEQLNNVILIQSHNENVVKPKESCHFGFYKPGSDKEITSLLESEWFTKNRLGLKTLHDRNALHLRFAECTHTKFEVDQKNFDENVLPFLD